MSSQDPPNKNKPTWGGQGDPPTPPPRPAHSESDFEAETYIGPAPGAGSSPPPKPPPKPRPPNQATVPASAAPGKPGAWSSTGSTIVGGAKKPGGAISDSWDQSANAETVPPGGRADSGFGSVGTLDRGRIGPYPLEREVGRGGMGVVYLGRDEKLGRPVAIKVLPDMFAQHPERLARFEREARLLASLNHANIASIYELGEDNGSRYLTLEYVPGQTLSERLHAGALPMDEAMHICAQIAEGLEAAHEKGVIHRDLKPGNVKITPEGIVKVLDFGLAKSSGPDSSADAPPDSPTGSIGDTQEGMILGTAGYMSPEQARGRALDKRTDVWSFGCVLFECLTGRSPFSSDTISDTIALILRTDPEWSALPPEVPDRVRELLQRCFIKDPKRRLRDLGEARIELQQAHESLSSFGGTTSTPSGTAVAQAAPSRATNAAGGSGIESWWQYVPWAMAGLSVAVAAMVTAALVMQKDSPTSSGSVSVAGVIQFATALPQGVAANSRDIAPLVGVSGDERWLVVSAEQEGRRQFFARSLDRDTFEPIEGLTAATSPFFSPDSQQLGLIRPGSIARLPVSELERGGPGGATSIVDGIRGDIAGATWTDDGAVVFAVTTGSGKGLYRAAAESSTRGGVLVLAAERDEEFVSPHAVRGSPDLLVYTARSAAGPSVRWLSLDDPAKGGTIVERGSTGFLMGKGADRFMVYAVGNSLQAQAVKINGTSGITAVGGVQAVAEGIASESQVAQYAVTDDGLLTYLPQGQAQRQIRGIALVQDSSAATAAGAAASALSGGAGVGGAVQIDPNDATRVAFISNDPAAPVKVLRDGRFSQVRGVRGRVTSIAWRPRPGKRSTLTMSIYEGGRGMVREWDEATGQLTDLQHADALIDPRLHGWNADGSRLYLSGETSETGRDLFEINEFTRNRTSTIEGDEFDSTPSPDDEFFAFVLRDDGVPRVHVMKGRVENADALVLPGEPSWSPLWIKASSEGSGSGTLLVMRPDGLHAVAMTNDMSAPFGDSTLIAPMTASPGSPREFDAAPDGSWLLLPVADDQARSEVRVIVNFDDLVRNKFAQ